MNKIILPVLVLLFVSCALSYKVLIDSTKTSLNSTDITRLRRNMLRVHNCKRAMHQNTSSLTLNDTLNSAAQAYADHLYANSLFEHSPEANNGDYGENLYWAWGSPSLEFKGGAASQSWYSERRNYNFTSGTAKDPSKPIGHFTAMVWDDVTQVGFGFACGSEAASGNAGYACYVVANYHPTPNIVGQYTSHIHRLI